MSGNAVGWARQRYVPCLSSAAEALLGLSRRWGGRADAVAAEIERRLDACVSAPGGAREALVPLLRLRDLHRYVEAEGDLRAVKLAVLGAAVAQGGSTPREPARRWRAARDLVANELPRILAVPGEDVDEAFKREVSVAGSRLGKLLRLCALLNLEAAGEYPPPGVNLRYVKGRFPEHAWESLQGGAWQPVAPLGRWEYLAADLAERVYRAGSSGRQRGAGAERTLDAAVEDPHAERGSKAPARPAAERVYCRLDSREPLAQLPLLPIEPERLVPDLLRHVQGRLGAEGVRQAVLVLAACAGAERGEAALLDKAALATACGAATRRAARERSRVLSAVLHLLGAVTIQRVGAGEKSERVRTARLITVLGWEGAQRSHGIAQAHGATQAHGAAQAHSAALGHGAAQAHGAAQTGGAAEEPVPGTWERLTLLADRVLWDAAGCPLGAALRELPPAVVALSPREHPHALAAAAWLLRHFSAQPGGPVQRSVPALLHEMGLADGPGALAGLKRDLQRLRELGVIGRWHQARDADGALHLRMEPPGMAGAAREVFHGGLRGAERTGARLARRKRMGGGSDWAVS